MHEGLCLEFTMLGLFIETIVFGNNIVTAMRLCVWLWCNWYFRIFALQMLAQMISVTRTLYGKLRSWFSSMESNQQPCGMLVTCQSWLQGPFHPQSWNGRRRNKPRVWNHLVLATVPNPHFSSGSGLEPNWNLCNGFHPIKKPTHRTEPGVFWPVPQFRQLWTLAPIKYLSSDCITIWYIHKRCSFACSFTSNSPLCDLINICGVAVEWGGKSGVFCRDSTNIDWIANWRIWGERACKSAPFRYISCCDMIRTQILNRGQSSECTKMRLW